MTVQWAPNHDNEANYKPVLTNQAGQSTAMVSQRKYPISVMAADWSVHVKGAPYHDIDMLNVSFTDYVAMRVTDLGFSSDPDDISKNATMSLPDLDQTTYNDWNGTLVHNPSEDLELSDDGRFWARVHWRFYVYEAT